MVWDNEHCRILWRILVYMRHYIKVDVDPVIITSFVLLQKYFQSRKESVYKMYITAITSFLISTKNNEIKCDILDAFKLFVYSAKCFIQYFSEDYLSNILELPNLKGRESISDEELSLVTACEMEMVESLNYIFEVDTPFNYLQKFVFPYLNEESKELKMQMEKITVYFIPCLEYFRFPEELIAASSVMITFSVTSKANIPNEVKEWLSKIKSKYNSETFQEIQTLFKNQMSLLDLSTKTNS